MWIYTREGFASVVKHRDKANTFLVRSRWREHLEALLPGSKITVMNQADYKYRCEISGETFGLLMMRAAAGVDYDNFKNAVRDDQYHGTLMSVYNATLRGSRISSELPFQREFGGPSDLWGEGVTVGDLVKRDGRYPTIPFEGPGSLQFDGPGGDFDVAKALRELPALEGDELPPYYRRSVAGPRIRFKGWDELRQAMESEPVELTAADLAELDEEDWRQELAGER